LFFVTTLSGYGALVPDFGDELVAKSCLVRAGEVLFKA